MTNTNEISQAVTRTVERAGHSLSDAFDKASDAAAPALKSITGVARQAGDALSHTGEQLRDAQYNVTHACRGYVRDKPMTSLGIAVGVGFVLGCLLRRRQD